MTLPADPFAAVGGRPTRVMGQRAVASPTPAGEEQLAEFVLHVAPGPIIGTVVRRCASGAIGVRLDARAGAGLILTKANVTALLEMLADCRQVIVETEWKTR